MCLVWGSKPLRSVALDQNAPFLEGLRPANHHTGIPLICPPHRDTPDLPIEGQYPKPRGANPSVVVLVVLWGFVFSSGGILPLCGVPLSSSWWSCGTCPVKKGKGGQNKLILIQHLLDVNMLHRGCTHKTKTTRQKSKPRQVKEPRA